jgi:arabinoxylan arabinofuranohydrolase
MSKCSSAPHAIGDSEFEVAERSGVMNTARASIAGVGLSRFTALLKPRFLIAAILSWMTNALPATSLADNPIVQTNYTTDPAPMVHDGRLYIYTGHDEDTLVNNFFTMNDWRVYSSADMVNWTDHGSPLKYSDFTWAKGDAWAGQCINRNGKFYYYVPMTQKSGGMAVGVATSTSPTGPFADALGHPLVSTGSGDIDPTVFIDDDGQAYLYWGNPNLWYVKLNQDMISYSGSPAQVSLTTAGFGARKDTSRATSYEEGPWFYKRDGRYYMVFSANGIPEQISYSTSTSPTGPWTFRGIIMPAQGASFTNHSGVVDFNGSSYFVYHNGALPGGGGYHRSVSIEPFTYNADGTFPTINMTTAGPPGVGNLNPYVTTEAETIAWESGVETEVCNEGGMDVTSINNGDYIKVKGVNFGTGATSFEARVSSASSGAIELRLDSQTGTLVGTCAVQNTGGLQTWATKSCAVSGATGLHDLYLKFTGGSGALFNFNWWKFVSRDPQPDVRDAGVTDAGATDAGARDAGAAGARAGLASGGAGGMGRRPPGTSSGMAPGSGGAPEIGGSSPTSGSTTGTGGGAAAAAGAGPTGNEAGRSRGCQSGAGRIDGRMAFLAFGFATLLRRRRASGPQRRSRQ